MVSTFTHHSPASSTPVEEYRWINVENRRNNGAQKTGVDKLCRKWSDIHRLSTFQAVSLVVENSGFEKKG
ncbi:MAG: hypothetical protein FJ042_06945 [Candidatus Cloacimonetes bacterium]|nr:hypothetical protein [Candidatus Cloacimonadota bacterium]